MQTESQPFVYIIGWTASNRYYIGVRYKKGCKLTDLGNTYFTSNKHIKILWHYSPPDIIDVYPCSSKEVALELEENMQRHFDVLRNPRFFNENITGSSFSTPSIVNDVSRTKISAALKGKPKSAAHIEAVRRAITNPSQETRAKRSASLKGKTPWNKGRTGVYSQEVLAKMSKSQKGRTLTEETREKMRGKHTKPISTPDGIFPSVSAAAIYYNIKVPSLIGRIKRNPTKYFYIRND